MPATQVLNEMESELGLASEQRPHCGKVNISRILHDDGLYLLRMEPEFQKALREARRVAFGQAIARLQQMSGRAVATLGKMMVEQTAPPSTRVRAAECIISHAAKAIEIEDIDARPHARVNLSEKLTAIVRLNATV